MRINFCGNYLCKLMVIKIRILQHLILVNAMAKQVFKTFIISNDKLLSIIRIQYIISFWQSFKSYFKVKVTIFFLEFWISIRTFQFFSDNKSECFYKLSRIYFWESSQTTTLYGINFYKLRKILQKLIPQKLVPQNLIP